jgi:hypothetical protein
MGASFRGPPEKSTTIPSNGRASEAATPSERRQNEQYTERIALA